MIRRMSRSLLENVGKIDAFVAGRRRQGAAACICYSRALQSGDHLGCTRLLLLTCTMLPTKTDAAPTSHCGSRGFGKLTIALCGHMRSVVGWSVPSRKRCLTSDT